jgi:hypothetical protein
MEKLMTPQRAQEFVYKQNHRKNKNGEWVEKTKGERYDMLNVQDYDVDGLDDTIVTKGGKVYSFNGFLPKDTDYPLRRAFLMEGKQHQNRWGSQEYDRYSTAKTKNRIFKLDAPRERAYKLNYDFPQQLSDFYPALQKYQKKAQTQIDNATNVILSDVLRPVWNATRQAHRLYSQVIDITDGTTFINFKNNFLNSELYSPIRQIHTNFDNLKPKRKTDLTNNFFDNYLSGKLGTLIQNAIALLILTKSQTVKMDENIQQEYASIIYNLIPKTQPAAPPRKNLLRSSSPQAQLTNEFLDVD